MSQAVVQAAQQVAQVQNRFQNLGGQIAKGMQIVEAKNQKIRAAREKAVRDRLRESRRKIKELDNNINTLGYADDEITIIKNMSVEKTDRFYALQNQLSQFENPRSPEAQKIVDEMNGIRNWFTNVAAQQKQRLKQREQYNADLGTDEYSSGISEAGQNKVFSDNAELINTGNFTAIDPVSGEFLWGEEGGYMGLASGTEYFMQPYELFKLIEDNEEMVLAKKEPLTTGQVSYAVKKFKKLLEDPKAMASLLADNPIAEAYGEDLQQRFDQAYDMEDSEERDQALDAIRDEIANGYETYLKEKNSDHIAELKANEEPDTPGDTRPTKQKTAAYDRRRIKNGFKSGSSVKYGDITIKKDGTGFKLYIMRGGLAYPYDVNPTASSLEDLYNKLGI